MNKLIKALAAIRSTSIAYLTGTFSLFLHIWFCYLWQPAEIIAEPIQSQWIEVALTAPQPKQPVPEPVAPAPSKPKEVKTTQPKAIPKPIKKTPPRKPVPKKNDLAPTALIPPLVKVEIPIAPTPTKTETVARTPPTNLSAQSNESRNGLTKGVVVLQRVSPEYPERALMRGIEGRVTIEFTIKPNGEIAKLSIVSAEPSDVFNEAALTAIKKWKFKQKIVDGVAVEQRTRQTLSFKLNHGR